MAGRRYLARPGAPLRPDFTERMSQTRSHLILQQLRRWRPRVVAAVLLLVFLTSGHDHLTQIEKIQQRGSLLMLTVNGAATYYWGAEGETGFEYDLASAFAEYLEVPLEVVVVPNLADLIPALDAGRGDFIAANLSRSPERRARLRFSPSYETVTQTVVYRRGSQRPDSMQDLADGRLGIIPGTSYEAMLREADLEYTPMFDSSIEDVFDAIANEQIDYTVIDSNILELNRRFFPSIRNGFDIGGEQRLAWATRNGNDDTLAQHMREFFTLAEDSGLLSTLKSRHYDHLDRYEPVGTYTFMDQMRERLPALRGMFEDAAAETGLDWRLLAAIGYQESHWNPDAVSPTGVRGIMMLTRQTAEQLGVENRTDPEQSIDGGARYIRNMIDRIPDRIDHPDRLWLALAAYNIGYGHLEDARVLTEEQGRNPDRWLDVRQALPLLTQERHFSRTRFGYARGYQAVHYVENIRTYYEILVWMDSREHPLIAEAESDTDRA